MAMNRAQFKKQLQDGLNTVFGLEYDRYPEEWRMIFDVESEGRKAYVEDVMMAGLGGAQVKAEGAGVTYDSTSETYTARYVFETIALAFAITEEAEEDGLYGSIGGKLSKAMARSFQHTKDLKGANILNNGFTGSAYQGGDGVALFSASHPQQNGSNGTNILGTAADLSESSLEDMLILIAGCTDDRGIPCALTPRRLIIPRQLKYIARRILASDLRVDTANNDINAIKSLGELPDGVAVNHRLTDTDAWFIKTDCPDGLKHIKRVALKGGVEGDFETGNMRYKKRERYAFGWSNWRAAFGTAGA